MSSYTSSHALTRRVLTPAPRTAFGVLDSGSELVLPGLRSGQYHVVLIPINSHNPEFSSNAQQLRTLYDAKVQITSKDAPSQGEIDSESPPERLPDFATFGDVQIDFLRHEIRRAGEPVVMTAFEFRVLRFFVANPSRVISRDELLQTVWGYNCYPTTRTVDNKILRLRQKLEPDPARPIHFQTVHGAGYKFVP